VAEQPYAPRGYVAVRRDRIGVVVINVLSRVFLSRRYRDTLQRAITDGYRYRAHRRRVEMGIVRCVEADQDGNAPSRMEPTSD